MRYCPEINLFDIPVKKPIKSSYVREKAGQGTAISVCALSGCCFHEQLTLRVNVQNYSMGVRKCQWISVQQKVIKTVVRTPQLELLKFVFGIVRGGYITNTIFHAPGRKSALRCRFPDRALSDVLHPCDLIL